MDSIMKRASTLKQAAEEESRKGSKIVTDSLINEKDEAPVVVEMDDQEDEKPIQIDYDDENDDMEEIQIDEEQHALELQKIIDKDKQELEKK